MQFYYGHTPEHKWVHTFICMMHVKSAVHSEVLQWCKDHFGPVKGRYRFDPDANKIELTFKDDCDALVFRMKWITEITKEAPQQV